MEIQIKFPDRRKLPDGWEILQIVSTAESYPKWESVAEENVISDQARNKVAKWLYPSLPVPIQQLLFSGMLLTGALEPDELGAFGVALLLQPVGVNEPGRKISRILDDRLEEG